MLRVRRREKKSQENKDAEQLLGVRRVKGPRMQKFDTIKKKRQEELRKQSCRAFA